MANRWLKWARPFLSRPHIWRFERVSCAKSAALGAFFAFVTPVAQVPAVVLMALIMRINVPIGIAWTFINTPLTFPFTFYAAFEIGSVILAIDRELPVSLVQRGSAFAIGSFILGVVVALLAYFLTLLLWPRHVGHPESERSDQQ